MSKKSKIVQAVPWDVPEKENPVRNLGLEYLKFLNTHLFSEAANHYLKYGYYTSAPYGTPDWIAYWDEQERRCREGYTVGGVRITGRHYFYLNFSRIKATKPGTSRKVWTFPRFIDLDYYFFHLLERVFVEGPYVNMTDDEGLPLQPQNLVVVKARRKGFSYKIANAVYAYNMNFIPASMNILAAYEKGQYAAPLAAIHTTLNFVNDNTDWFKRRTGGINTRTHFQNSYKEVNEYGVEVVKGYLNEFKAVSFKDNAFKGIGESATVIGFEEAGRFYNLIPAITVSGEPLVRDGEVKTGSILVWGSAGDMEGGSNDLCDLFYNPENYGFMSFDNIYDGAEDEEYAGKCGLFVDDLWYSPGVYKDEHGKVHPTVDEDGNSYRRYALERFKKKDEEKKKGPRNAYLLFRTQQPIHAKDAFLRTEGSVFPVIELQRALARLRQKAEGAGHIGVAGRLTDAELENGRPKFIPDTSGALRPLTRFNIKPGESRDAVLVVYEFPTTGHIPDGLYYICVDPVAIDGLGGDSINAAFVYKARNKFDPSGDVIVATYCGRTERMKEYNRNLLLLSEFYGEAKIAFENDRGTIKSDFENWKKLHLLCYQSNTVISKVIGNSRVNRIYGNSMSSEKMKMACEIYLYDWLLTKRGKDENGNPIYNLDLIPDIPLLEELISYRRDQSTKFNRVMAMFQLMLVIEENANRVVEKDRRSQLDEIVNMLNEPFKINKRKPARILPRPNLN